MPYTVSVGSGTQVVGMMTFGSSISVAGGVRGLGSGSGTRGGGGPGSRGAVGPGLGQQPERERVLEWFGDAARTVRGQISTQPSPLQKRQRVDPARQFGAVADRE